MSILRVTFMIVGLFLASTLAVTAGDDFSKDRGVPGEIDKGDDACFFAWQDDPGGPFGGPAGMDDSGGRRGKGRSDDMRGPGFERRKHLEQLRMLKLLEFLDLDDDQEVAFLTRFKALRSDLQANDSARRDMIADLATAVDKGNASDTEMKAKIDSVQNLFTSMVNLHRTFLKEMESTLSVEQMAKYVIFEQRFEFELLKHVRQFQDRREGLGKNRDTSNP